MESDTIISVNGKTLKNVREFKYLGHTLTNELKPKYLSTQIGLAYAGWNDHKKFLTDQRIKLWIRIHFAESVIRGRLTYAVETGRLEPHERTKIDSIWIRMCRKMMKGGFRRKKLEGTEEDSFRFYYSNNDVVKICKTKLASGFCGAQHLRFIGHVARMGNDASRKQWLYSKPHNTHTDQWILLGRDWILDPQQVR